MPSIHLRWWAAAAVVVVTLVWAVTADKLPTSAAPAGVSRTIAEPSAIPESPGTNRSPASLTTTPTNLSTDTSAASPSAAVATLPDDSAKSERPDHRGPGAVLSLVQKNAPTVPRGQSALEYVERYYAALREGDVRTAAGMLPSEKGRMGDETFARLNAGYEVSSFATLQAVHAPEGVSLLVVTRSPTAGIWNVMWEFTETARGLQLRDLTYARPGEAGCH